MQEMAEELERFGARVLLVAYDEQALLEAKMLRGIEVGFPILIDPSKETYWRWGMGRGNVFTAMLSPKLNVRYAKLLLKGEPFLGLAPDMFQLGGDFVVDREGRIAFAHIMRDNGDRAPVSDLITKLSEIK
jgi:peroxiredoxin